MNDQEKKEKIREEIAKACATSYFGMWERLNEDGKNNWRDWVDKEILAIKGLVIESDNQELPQWQRHHLCVDIFSYDSAQQDMSDFRRIIE